MNLELTPEEIEIVEKHRRQKRKESNIRKSQAEYLELCAEILKSGEIHGIGEIEKYVRNHVLAITEDSEQRIVFRCYKIIHQVKDLID